MTSPVEMLQKRVDALERETYRLRRALALFFVITLAAGAWSVRSSAQQPTNPLRVRGLIIEDGEGRPRISLGAPLSGQGGNPRTGLRITDTRGFERFGVGLFEDGRLVMGIDGPPPATGPVGNLERINLVAEANGGSYIVFKDRESRIVGRMYLDEQNKVWMEFSDLARQPALRRRIGLSGEESLPAVQ